MQGKPEFFSVQKVQNRPSRFRPQPWLPSGTSSIPYSLEYEDHKMRAPFQKLVQAQYRRAFRAG